MPPDHLKAYHRISASSASLFSNRPTLFIMFCGEERDNIAQTIPQSLRKGSTSLENQLWQIRSSTNAQGNKCSGLCCINMLCQSGVLDYPIPRKDISTFNNFEGVPHTTTLVAPHHLGLSGQQTCIGPPEQRSLYLRP